MGVRHVILVLLMNLCLAPFALAQSPNSPGQRVGLIKQP
jgi:hypothetical protein